MDHANLEIQVVPELGDLDVAVERSRRATSQAQVATTTAVQESRQVAHRLGAAGGIVECGVEDVNLDEEEIYLDGERLTEARAEEIARDIAARHFGDT